MHCARDYIRQADISVNILHSLVFILLFINLIKFVQKTVQIKKSETKRGRYLSLE